MANLYSQNCLVSTWHMTVLGHVLEDVSFQAIKIHDLATCYLMSWAGEASHHKTSLQLVQFPAQGELRSDTIYVEQA